MIAYVLKNINLLEREEVPTPSLEKGWAIIKTKASGICSSDIPRIFEKGTYHFPTIPGHEFSGIVVQIDKEHSNLLGKRVGVFPLIPCKKCEDCQKENYETCSNYDYIGSRRDGAFAEYVKVPIWNLIEMNESVSFEEIALMEPLCVAFSAVRKAKLNTKESVAVVGTGMIGISAGVFARTIAKDVTIFGRSENKKRLIDKVSGLKYEYDSNEDTKYDVVIEAVGTTESISKSIRIVKNGGRVVLMGNPASDIVLDQKVYWLILRKQVHLLGTWNSKFLGTKKSDWTVVKDILENKKTDFSFLITHFFDKNELKKALEMMRNHTEPYCKVMILWGDDI